MFNSKLYTCYKNVYHFVTISKFWWSVTVKFHYSKVILAVWWRPYFVGRERQCTLRDTLALARFGVFLHSEMHLSLKVNTHFRQLTTIIWTLWSYWRFYIWNKLSIQHKHAFHINDTFSKYLLFVAQVAYTNQKCPILFDFKWLFMCYMK